MLSLDVSVIQLPVLHFGRICYTEDCAASERVCPAAALCCCLWTCLPEMSGQQQLLNAGEAAVRQVCSKAARAAIGQTRPKAAHTDSLYADYSEPQHGHELNWRRLVAYM